MAQKCQLTDTDIKKLRKIDLGNLRRSVSSQDRLSNESIATIKKGVYDIIKDLTKFNLSGNTANILVEHILKGCKQFVNAAPDFFNSTNLTNLLLDSNHGITTDPDRREDKTTSILEPVVTNMDAGNINEGFLLKAYGSATDVRLSAQKLFKRHLVDSMIINRQARRMVTSVSDLNNNVRDLNQRLLDTIYKYIKATNTDPSAKELLSERWIMYDSEGNYTGILDKVQGLIDQTLIFTPETLSRLRRKSLNGTTKAQNAIDAYNANVLLRNIDSFIKLQFGDNVEVSNFGSYYGNSKYNFAEKGADNNTTWRKDDNIDVAKEVSGVTKMMIETSKFYSWDSRETPLSDIYIKFQDFNHILAKVKQIGLNGKAYNIDFKESYFSNEILPTLSKQTQTLIKSVPTLASLINRSRLNPQNYFSAIFELLSNKQFYTYTKTKPEMNIYQDFQSYDKDILFSCYKSIFSNSDAESIHKINNQDITKNYYSYIAQVADSIFRVNFLQYYLDDDGTYRVRSLQDQSFDNLSRDVEDAITLPNSLTANNFASSQSLYQITPYYDEKKNFTGIGFKIPGLDYNINVDISGAIKIYDNNGVSKIITSEDWANPKFRDFLENVLHQNLGIDSDTAFTNYVIESFNGTLNAANKLFETASRVLMNQCISNTLLKDIKDPSELRSRIKEIYSGKKTPGINYKLGEIKLIYPTDIETIKTLAKAKASMLGLTVSTSVKDGEGNSQSTTSFSRLYGARGIQWELQNRNRNSATLGSCIISNPNILKELYTAKEVKTDNVKSQTDFTVSEFTYSSFILDYIGGKCSTEDRHVVGNGIVAIVPSENSDKTTIARLLIDTNQQVKYNENLPAKAIKDLTHSEFQQFIDLELGRIYTKSYENINNDWNKLISYLHLDISDHQGLKNFQELNDYYINRGLNPVEEIQAGVLMHNLNHPNNPICLIDQVHYQNAYMTDSEIRNLAFNAFYNENERIVQVIKDYNEKHPDSIITKENFIALDDKTLQSLVKKAKLNTKKLEFNQSLVSIINRSNPKYIQNLGITLDPYKYKSSSEFWNFQKRQILNDLADSDFQVDMTNTDQKEILELSRTHPDWITEDGKMTLGKITFNGKTYTISDRFTAQRVAWSAGFQTFDELIKQPTTLVQIHPELETYNYLDYLFSEEFLISTVGSHIAHPSKYKNGNSEYDLFIEEGLRKKAQNKRNVSMTAAMQEFLLNTLDGIPSTYNVAVIDDIHDTQSNVAGVTDSGIKPYDGATFVNPFIVHLENNSLGGAKAGITKKQFVHFYNENTGTGGIIKTAGFGFTNDWMRNSLQIQNMMKKMTNQVWRNENSDVMYDADITTDYNGNKISYDPIYYKKNGAYYKLESVTKVDTNSYNVVSYQCDSQGEIILDGQGNPILDQAYKDPVTVESNYQLWQLFGGKDSQELVNNKLQPSETSITNVVKAINLVGQKKSRTVLTGEDVFQPLKHSDIHYLATAGAVKQGAANINNSSAYTDETPLNFMRVRMNQAGIQLDKEHHADGAELSLMTQVISACASRGYTMERANQLYQALRTLTDLGTKEFSKAFSKYVDSPETNKSELQTIVNKTIVNALATSGINEENFASTIAKDLIQEVKKGNKIKWNEVTLPMSDNTIYSKLVSTIAVTMTRSGIKMKIPGLLSVLTPSKGIIKFYGDRKLESFDNPEVELEELQRNQVPVFNLEQGKHEFHNIEIGRNYYVTDAETGEIKNVLISTPRIRKQLIQDTKSGKFSNIVENVKDGRDLASYNVKFETTSGERFSLYDVDSIMDLYDLADYIENNDFNAIATLGVKYIPFIEVARAITSKHPELREQLGDIYLSDLNVAQKTQAIISLLYSENINPIEIYNAKFVEKHLRRRTQTDLQTLTKGLDGRVVQINGKQVIVDKDSIDVIPYELVMPKTFIKEFNLDKYDNLYDIKNDKLFFLKRMVKNWATKLDNEVNYDIELKRLDGRHYYLLQSKNQSQLDNCHEKIINTKYDEEGKLFRIDDKGKVIYQMNSENDKVFIDNKGNEIIITDNPNFYVHNLNYNGLHLTQNYKANYDELMSFIKDEPKLKSIVKFLQEGGIEKQNLELNKLPDVTNMQEQEAEAYAAKNFPFQYIFREAQTIYTSFIKSLDIVAARIPAQSMQSFMTMRIAGFDNPNINTAYVSTAQIWLQGSDYK